MRRGTTSGAMWTCMSYAPRSSARARGETEANVSAFVADGIGLGA